MMTAYVRINGAIIEHVLGVETPLPDHCAWIDLSSPSQEEAAFMKQQLGVDIPTDEEIREIEVSSRLYTDQGFTYLITPVVVHSDAKPAIRDLAFIVTHKTIVTVRYSSPKSIATCAQRILRNPSLAATPIDALVTQLDSITDRLADVLETVGGRVDMVASRIFDDQAMQRWQRLHRRSRSQPDRLQAVLNDIGAVGELTNKVRTSLAGIDRLIAFAATVIGEQMTKEQKSAFKTLSRDLRSLTEHAAFLNSECNFLLDATLGMISIHQNTVITIFSIVAVVFLPPTLIASIYGMNFHFMPELDWSLGYPLALGAMLLSAVLPVIYFRWRNWL